MDALATFSKNSIRSVPAFRPGDTVKVHQKIKEGDKERTQLFEGLVISRKHGSGTNAMFTVRKIASGVGVERTYPLHSPFIDKIEVVKSVKVRRAKLYFIRHAKGKRAKMKELKSAFGDVPAVPAEAPEAQNTENAPQ